MLFSEYRSWLPGCVAGLVGFAGLTLPVLAQEAAEASAGDAVALEEIVVTARKRAETLLEVPVAVTALTADDIDQKGIENLNDVALFTPGLTYFDSIQNQLGTPVIRGISQTNLNSPDRNVAIFYGGVYLSSTSGANLEILDVDRVEVVKVRSRRCMVAMPSTARSTSCRPRRPRRSSPRSRRPSAPTSATRASSWSPAR